MSVSDERLLRDVEQRLEHLIRLSQQQAEHIRTLIAENARLTALNDAQEAKIKALNRQLSIASMYVKDAKEAQADIAGFKEEIDNIAKEVETCIAYLERSV